MFKLLAGALLLFCLSWEVSMLKLGMIVILSLMVVGLFASISAGHYENSFWLGVAVLVGIIIVFKS